MAVTIPLQTGSVLTLDRFWRWIKDHPNCILRAGTSDAFFYDHDDLHWHLAEDPGRNLTVQLISGKELLGEIVINARDVLFVQAEPDAESGEPGRFLFELVGGAQEETYALYHFLVAHAFEDESTHQTLVKH